MKKILLVSALVGTLASCTSTEKGTAIGAASGAVIGGAVTNSWGVRPSAPSVVAWSAQRSANRRSATATASIATATAGPTKLAAANQPDQKEAGDREIGAGFLCLEVKRYLELNQPLTLVRLVQLATYCPPFAVRVDPVMKPAASETRKTTQRAISSGSPSRPSGICGRIFSSRTGVGMALTISVAI